MKKKFINGMLVVAMMIAAMGSFVSCKDHDEEMYSELKELDGKLKQELLDQIATLKGELGKVDEAQKRCEQNCSTFKSQIEAWQIEVNNWRVMVENNYVTKQEFNDTVNSINNRIINHEIRIAELEAARIALEKQDSILAADIEKANQVIERVEREYKAADAALKDSLTREIVNVQTTLTRRIDDLERDLNAQIVLLQKNDSIFNVEIDALKQTVAGHTTDIQKLQGDVATNSGLISTLQDAVNTINNTTIPGLQNQITTNKEAIDALKDRVSTLETNYGKLIGETIPAIVADVDSVFRLAKNDSVRIDMLEDGLEALKEQHVKDNAALVAKIDSICGELDGIKESVVKVAEEAAKNLAAAEKVLNERIDKVVEILNTKVDQSVFDKKVTEIINAYQAADQLLQDQIDDLADELDALKQAVEKNTKDIKDLTDKYDLLADKLNAVDESLKNLITGILLQATENPVFGSFSLPVNVQSNVLMAYYGETGEYGIEFPSKYPRYYVNAIEALSEKDIEMLGVTSYTEADGATIVGNAGKVYVTVNPSNVNFEGQTLPIVNSLDEESGIKLSPLKYSDKKLTFGYSRSAENGLYEADATLAAADVNKVSMKFDFNASDIKATVKDVLNPLNGVNITNAVNTVTDVLGQFNQKLDANALKASWTDASGVTRNVYSQYNLAATAVKPLSYAFMSDVNVSNLPGISRAEKLINKVANKVKVNIPEFNVSLDVPTIKKIEIKDLSDELLAEFKFLVKMDTTITVPQETVNVDAYDQFGNKVTVKPVVVGGQSIYIYVEQVIDMTDEVKDLYDEFEAPVKDVNKILEDLEVFMDDVNALLDEFNKLNDYAAKFEDLMDRGKNKLITYLDKLNNKVCSLINSANKALQPVLLVQTDGSFARLSQAVNYPSKINGTNFSLIATSYTAEAVAPAYKKLVGVTNVYSMDGAKNAQAGDANCKAALDAANSGNVAKVLEGDVQKIDFTAKKGYIYEIVYTAVDFHGKVAAKKYYVTVK